MWDQKVKKALPATAPIGAGFKKVVNAGANDEELLSKIDADIEASKAQEELEKQEAIDRYREKNPKKQSYDGCCICGC